jgi:hypothetical protein
MKHKKDAFWISFSDIMTSLFFLMLILFGLYHAKVNASLQQLKKIKQVQKSIQNIDKKYFDYDSTNKKHILNIPVQFKPASADIMDLNYETRKQLLDAGYIIKNLISKKDIGEAKIQYLLIIEGQASNDKYKLNDDLSYHRAKSLYTFWTKTVTDFRELENCELIIGGSGVKGVPRTQPDIYPKNQRFLITIIPKIGSMKL